MLTKQDLDQMRKLVREEIGNEAQAIRDDIGSDIATAQLGIRREVSEFTDRLKNVEIRLTKNHNELKQEIKQVLNFLDRENVKTVKRVKVIEDQLRISPQ